MLAAFRRRWSDLLTLRRSAVFRLWLKKSWTAWVCGILYSIFASKVFPLLALPVLRGWFPPGKGTGMTWLRSTFSGRPLAEDPRVAIWSGRLSYLVWLFGFALFMTLLELKIRPAIAAARARARSLEAEADAQMGKAPERSAILLKEALAHAVDADHARALEARVQALAGGVARPRRDAGATTLSPPPPPAPPAGGSGAASRSRYRLRAEIGRGGMGVVWRAWDPVLDREIAVKELPPSGDRDLHERFRREARALARLSHPNVVQVYDFVEDGPRKMIAMELVDGGSLDDELARGPVTVERGLEIAEGLIAALQVAHARGIVHRDVKPQNVLCDREGSLKVTDFGLALLAGTEGATAAGAVLGTPRYMSPEQAAGRPVDARSDLYSLGATLFHVFAGRPPFEGDLVCVLRDHLATAPPRLRALAPAVPAPLAEWVDALLAKDPASRASLEAGRAAIRAARLPAGLPGAPAPAPSRA